MRPSTKKWLLVLASLAVFGMGSTRIDAINARRKAAHLVLPPLPSEMAPSALYTPLLALGRAPLVDVLWMRATKLKDEGRIFDALQLARRICDLQPKFPDVWAFQAWNMSYNISVTCRAPEERWKWVRNGYELLRDKGIPLNPNNTQLYRELAWILFHKVGDFMDDHHFYYKNEFAREMESILGKPPKDFERPGRVRGDFYRDYDFQSLAEAPQTIEKLLNDADVKALADRLREFGFDATKPGIYLGLLDSVARGKVLMPNTPEHEQENRMQAFLKFFGEATRADAKTRLEKFWRAYRLRNEVRLDPVRIVELQKWLGVTVDFRLAEAHALYWANVGMEMGSDKREPVDVHKLNTNRIEFFCLQKFFHRGRLAMSPEADMGEPPLMSPDLRMVPILFRLLIEESEKYLVDERSGKPVSENFRTNFVGFVRSAILRYHEVGSDADAKEYFEYLREHYPDPVYDKGFDHFLSEQVDFDRDLNDFRIVMARIEALVSRAILNYAYDEDDQAVAAMQRAKQVYNIYQTNAISDRQRLQGSDKKIESFASIVTNLVHYRGGMFNRYETYVRVCRKMNIEPLPPAPEEPAGTENATRN